jgi:hypothetical protein
VVTGRPSWQIDACPSWCAGDHHEGDHPEDRQHRSVSFAVPVVTRRTRVVADQISRSAESAEYEVGLSRIDGELETWLYLGEGPGESIEVSAESAHRLLRAAEARLGAGS